MLICDWCKNKMSNQFKKNGNAGFGQVSAAVRKKGKKNGHIEWWARTDRTGEQADEWSSFQTQKSTTNVRMRRREKKTNGNHPLAN